ncbi:MAG TPA: BrnT family toxin [Longimicrobium sp.]|nr:BrnT family toxin [Longimicrobium sp.]
MLDYEWHPLKAERNYVKHGVRFGDATSVFADPAAITVEDEYPDEERYAIVGHDGAGRLLVVNFTWRGENLVRLISARRATRAEAQTYYMAEP